MTLELGTTPTAWGVATFTLKNLEKVPGDAHEAAAQTQLQPEVYIHHIKRLITSSSLSDIKSD